jgi:hypothetical protein
MKDKQPSIYWLIAWVGSMAILFMINYQQIQHQKKIQEIFERGERLHLMLRLEQNKNLNK